MLIGSKLPPEHVETTYFSSGRAAFSFLIGEVSRPRRVYLPSFVCWSLVSAMEKRFPKIELKFYSVDRDLRCRFPQSIDEDETLVFIHYFGHRNRGERPGGSGVLFEDQSHSYLSNISETGDFVFGSYRKIMKVGDGGFVKGFYNPIYEPGRKLDTWLRYQATDWRDVREAENMLDRQWIVGDISSQSLAILLQANADVIRQRRCKNERFLAEHFSIGVPLITFHDDECPLLHCRTFESPEERDRLREHLAGKGVFTSIHWPTHPAVKKHSSECDVRDTLWLEDHVLCIPVSEDYNLNDMEYICDAVNDWS